MSDKDQQNAAPKEGEGQPKEGEEHQQQQQQPQAAPESHAEPLSEKDDDEKELEKLERGDPEMIKICNIIMNQLEEFKV